ncbi:MAG: hypothetical protein QNJ45_10295 [Ardenticatenaceae bacterium]|nr:hypothetical protein [Ardenticatenaceae bacterium]
MDLHQRQQFDFLLMTATERFVDRLIQRQMGAQNALQRLREDPNGEGVWLDDFVDAIFQDFLLDNVAGACFVLRALAKSKLEAVSAGKNIETTLVAMSKQAFAQLLRSKAEEVLEQESMYA